MVLGLSLVIAQFDWSRLSGLNEISSVIKVCATLFSRINVLQLCGCFFQHSIKMTNEIAVVRATCTAPTNIAVIKYCQATPQQTNNPLFTYLPLITGGKSDEDLILPLNASLSVSLHQDDVRVEMYN